MVIQALFELVYCVVFQALFGLGYSVVIQAFLGWYSVVIQALLGWTVVNQALFGMLYYGIVIQDLLLGWYTVWSFRFCWGGIRFDNAGFAVVV